MKRREFISLLGGAAAAWPCVGRLMLTGSHTLGPACYFLSPGRPDPRHGGDSGDLVSQRREKPNARSQKSFDRNEDENARWSGAQATRRSGTAARNMQARTRRGAGAADGDLGGAARHQLVARRAGAGVPGDAEERDEAMRGQIR